MSTDYDGVWKEALDEYLDAGLALLFPAAHAEVDWSRGYESLDKELQQIAPESEVGKRYVDKLYKVWRKDGTPGWILIHIEVQVWPDGAFEERMFVYNYRAYDRVRRPVASLAVLADENPKWRPSHFGWTALGCTHALTFPPAKLLDFRGAEEALMVSANPFAKVVLAHLKTQETRGDPAARHLWKIRLVRALYEQGLSAGDVRKLFRFIDWLMDLPLTLDRVFWQQVRQVQEERKMPFITTPQRVGRLEGLFEGIRVCLKIKFGEAGLQLVPEVERLYEADKVEAVLHAIEAASMLDDVRKVVAAQSAGQGP